MGRRVAGGRDYEMKTTDGEGGKEERYVKFRFRITVSTT
jgi:hypothetical protein